MSQFSFGSLHLVLQLLFIFHLQFQLTFCQDGDASEDVVSNYEPSLAMVIGILGFMFFFTFILLMYTKFCSTASSIRADQQVHPGLVRSRSRFSGINKKVIESLPFFRFSSLKGYKEGLECAVCLSKFEEIEILRLLPRCRHAFHIHCIDQWLENHSTCPLCRHKLSAEDLTLFTNSSSLRFLRYQSEIREDSNIELFVQREEENQGSSRFSIGGSFRTIEMVIRQGDSSLQESAENANEDEKVSHKFNGKITICDFIFKNRWSSVSSSDLLISEMLQTSSSDRFFALDSSYGKLTSSNSDVPSTSSKRNSDENSIQVSRFVALGGKRSMSEITGVSRYGDLSIKNRTIVSSLFEDNARNERIRQLWLPIAKRTLQWFANRERRSSQVAEDTTLPLDV